MIVDVTGFGWSGSGAVHDLLREYDDVQFAAFHYDWEFTLLWMVDGISDLEYKICSKHSRFFDSNAAIKRFVVLTEALEKEPALHYDEIFKGSFSKECKQYVNDLIQVSFYGNTFHEAINKTRKDRLISKYNHLLRKVLGNHLILNYLKRDLSRTLVVSESKALFLSYNVDNFIERTHQLMNKLLSFVRKNNDKPLITDQLFPPDCPSLFFKYISESAKCIIVRRDPRDTYLLAKERYQNSIPIPVDRVEDFILFYKKTIEETMLADDQQILNIRFEDLIYDYENAKALIESFIGISVHSSPRKFFNPAVSVNNTQLFKKYHGYEEDMLKIEEALPNSLYPFDKYKVVSSISNKVF